MSEAAARVADASGNWVDRIAPYRLRPFLRLARADRPIGSWLLLLPCWWSAALASGTAGHLYPDPSHLAAFAVGAIAMRGAGCTWNDLIDRDIDALVERTRSRPLPSGQVTPKAAAAFLVMLALIGLGVLLTFNWFAIGVGIASLGIVAAYPFMKRITWWPQVTLGLAFSWGALMGWSAVFGRLDAPALLLYAGSIAWVIGYDTIYAHQDRDDDALIGVKSTARLFGERSHAPLAFFYTLAVVLVGSAGFTTGAGWTFALGMAAFAGHLAWQVARLDVNDPALCLRLFKSNRDAGLILFAAFALDGAVRAL